MAGGCGLPPQRLLILSTKPHGHPTGPVGPQSVSGVLRTYGGATEKGHSPSPVNWSLRGCEAAAAQSEWSQEIEEGQVPQTCLGGAIF